MSVQPLGPTTQRVSVEVFERTALDGGKRSTSWASPHVDLNYAVVSLADHLTHREGVQ